MNNTTCYIVLKLLQHDWYYTLNNSKERSDPLNIQFKKGVLNLCVLVLLDKKDRYGYELVQKISDQIAISEGSVYPLLRRLTKEGYFTTYLQESTEGPPRKYYRLTDLGRTYLQEQLNEWKSFTEGVNHLIEEGVKDE